MKREEFSISGGMRCLLFFLILFFLFLSPVYAQSPQTAQPSDQPADQPSDKPADQPSDQPAEQPAEQAADSRIQLILPEEGSKTITKKPRVKCAIKTPFEPTKLLVLLDGTDISGILDITPDGFEYKANTLLTSGEHTLSVTLTTQDGQELKREFKFSTVHSKVAEEIYSSNEITTITEKKAVKKGDTVTNPSWKVESNLASESKVKIKEWEFIFQTNLRYFDQNMTVTPPPDKGFDLANYLFQAKYNGEKINFLAETGDVTIDETPYTVTGLARRGGNLVFESKDLNLKLRTFDVKSEQVFGFVGGLGLTTTPKDHIMGASADWGIISDKLRFRTIYVRGGEQGDSTGVSTTPTTPTVTPPPGGTPTYGTSSTSNQRKGDVLGFLLTSDFFEKKFVTEAELDFSRFDQDTSDEFKARRDIAYRFKAGGTIKDYTYEALYEYIGPEYEVIGNQGLVKNRRGYSLKAGGNFFKFNQLNLSFSKYIDNVKSNGQDPKLYTTQGTLDYTFSKFENLPIVISYQKTMARTKNEPQDFSHTDTDTDTITGTINYKKGPWDFGFSTSFSFQNDRTYLDIDTTTVTYSFTPIFTKDLITITPCFSFNRTLDHSTGVHTNTYLATLDLQGNLLNKRVTYGLGGTYTVIRSSDGLSKSYTQSGNFNVYYLLFKELWGFLNPSVGIRGLYNRTNDKVLHQTTSEFALYLVLQTSMKFLF